MYKSNFLAGCRLSKFHIVPAISFNQRPKEISNSGKVIFVKNCVLKDNM